MKNLALNILDIVQNSVRAGAGLISMEITESEVYDTYIIKISDNGSGIPDEILPTVTDPFVTTRTKRRFGLGLPLLKYHAELTGGRLEIESRKGAGTKVCAYFSFSHLDRQPLGDIAGVLMILVASNPAIEFIYEHRTDRGEYYFSTREVKEYLGEELLSDHSLLVDLKAMVNENLMNIGASGLNNEAA
jgi:hypothetical protein